MRKWALHGPDTALITAMNGPERPAQVTDNEMEISKIRRGAWAAAIRGDRAMTGIARRGSFSVVLFAFLLTMLGCAEPPVAPLRVGINPWVGYDPLVLAREQNLLDPQRVRVVELGSSAQSLRSLRNHVLEAAALTLDEALRLADQGFPLQIIAVLDVSHGADAVVGRASINHPADLAGKTIGVEDSAVGALMLGRVLQAGGLERQSVKVRRIELADHEPAWRQGKIDALVTFEPVRSQLLAQGAKVIFDSHLMPGEIIDVLVVRRDVLAARADDIVALLSAWEQGRRRLDERDSAAIEMLARGTELDPGTYRQTLDGLTLLPLEQSHAWMVGTPPPLKAKSSGLVQVLAELGLIQRPVLIEDLIAANPAADALTRLATAAP